MLCMNIVVPTTLEVVSDDTKDGSVAHVTLTPTVPLTARSYIFRINGMHMTALCPAYNPLLACLRTFFYLI